MCIASVIGSLVPRWNFFFHSAAAFLVKRATLTLYHMMVGGLEFGMTVQKTESFYKRGIITFSQKTLCNLCFHFVESHYKKLSVNSSLLLNIRTK